MVTGGAEAAITGLTIAGFQNMKALSSRNDAPEQASRPFDKERDGFVLGDGAAVVVLESLSHARKRGATILGEVLGYGLSADAHHMTQPAPAGEGAQRAMQDCLADGGIDPDHRRLHQCPRDLDASWATSPRRRRSRRCSATTPGSSSSDRASR